MSGRGGIPVQSLQQIFSTEGRAVNRMEAKGVNAHWRRSVTALERTWNKSPKHKRQPLRIRRGELYLATLTRGGTSPVPVVVLQTDYLNREKFPSTVVVPCTDDGVADNFLRVGLPIGIVGDNKKYACMVDSITMINNTRFQRLIGRVPDKILSQVTSNIRRLVGGGPAKSTRRAKQGVSPSFA